MVTAWEYTSEGGGGADSHKNVLPCGSAGSTLVWSGDTGAHRDNDTAVRGRACEFLEAGHT